MINKNIILTYLSDNKKRLKDDYHLTKIGLFGSVARDEQNDSSDIDLIVEFEPNTQDLYSLKLKLKKEIQTQFNKPVDICRLKYIKPFFKNNIQAEIRYV